MQLVHARDQLLVQPSLFVLRKSHAGFPQRDFIAHEELGSCKWSHFASQCRSGRQCLSRSSTGSSFNQCSPPFLKAGN